VDFIARRASFRRAVAAATPARTKGNNMPNAKKRAGYSQKDLRDVSDNPELTKADFARAKPFAEAFPDLAASIRKGRGPNRAPTKKLVSLRLSPEVIEHFKATGHGWQSSIDETFAQGRQAESFLTRSDRRSSTARYWPVNWLCFTSPACGGA
jgi:uncharacterized protein (DUF4415 family)